jgi:hypothetical protein
MEINLSFNELYLVVRLSVFVKNRNDEEWNISSITRNEGLPCSSKEKRINLKTIDPFNFFTW